MAYNVEEDSK